MYASTSTNREKWITRSSYRTSPQQTAILRPWLCSMPGAGNSNRPDRKHALYPGERCCTIGSAIPCSPCRAIRSTDTGSPAVLLHRIGAVCHQSAVTRSILTWEATAQGDQTSAEWWTHYWWIKK